MAKHFIPVALDTYFRGAGDEVEFCKKLKAGGNHLAVGSASGVLLGQGKEIRMREKELAPPHAPFRLSRGIAPAVNCFHSHCRSRLNSAPKSCARERP